MRATVPSPAPVRRILIVCHANTSRSIIAEAVLLRLLSARGLGERYAVSSAGIAPFARDGSLVSLDARFVLREIGIDLPPDAGATDLKRHPELLEAADLVLAMTEEQRTILAAKFPAAAGKRVLLVRELAGHPGDIDDPSMKDEDVFCTCRDDIMRCLDDGWETLLSHLEA